MPWPEANRNGSEHSGAVPVSEALLEVIATLLSLRNAQRKTSLNQRHLGRQMISLEDFNASLSIAETDIFRAAVITGTVQPDGIHHRGSDEF